MLKTSRNVLLLALVAGLALAAPQAFAKKKGDAPAGWSKGEKKGWGGESLPPGLAKKNADEAKKEAEKAKKEAEEKAKKAKKEAEKAKKEIEKKAKEAEKEAGKKSEQAKKKAKGLLEG